MDSKPGIKLALWIVMVCLAVPAFAQTPLPEEETAPSFQVTYVTGSSLYLDAGTDQGLRLGDKLELLHDGVVIASLKVTDISSRRAVCSIENATLPATVGDQGRLLLEDRPPAPAVTTPPVTSARAEASRQRRRSRNGFAGIHGRVGVRFLSVNDRSEADGGFTQPALDLRLDGQNVGGSPLDLAVDVRSRFTSPDSDDGDDGETNVYRLALTWHQRNPGLRVTLGRQFAATLAAVSIFDGVLVDFNRDRWSVGGFSGTQPDRDDMAYSSDIREHGAYFQVRGGRTSAVRWSLTTGLIGSYEDSEVNREFLYVQGRLVARKFSVYLAQEVDYNRDWKEDLGEDTIDPTSTFVSLSYRPTGKLTLRGGYDNRRSIRLYRDRTTPETEFDDSFRQGYWTGATIRWTKRFRTGLDYRASNSDSLGDADSYTLTLGTQGLTSWDLGLSSRSTHYTNDNTEGWLHSVAFGFSPLSRLHLELLGGIRTEESRVAGYPDEDTPWYGIDLDLTLGRNWYLLLSAERTDGDFEQYDQFYASVTYRF